MRWVAVDADAVSADQARRERQEIPFRAGRLQHLLGWIAELDENDRQLVHQRDVEVALVSSMTFAASATSSEDAR
jgi:hypothetical protein